jgi:hypothetical protein
VNLPYASFPVASQTIRQSILPFPQYTGQTFSGAPLGKTWYDSFQLNITKRFSHGLTANVNYNYSKSLELMSSPDPFNRNWGKNLGAFDLPNQFRATIQYTVPELSKGGWGFLSNKYASHVLSGWGIGAYLNYQSAGIIARPSSTSTTPINQFLGYGPGSAQLKQNADGSYMNPWSIDWTDYSGKHHTDPLNINCHCFDVTKTQVLNPAAWTNIPDGQWGAQQDAIRNFRTQRQPTENANFSRNFRIKEGINFNVRVEFQNIFNRMQYGAIGGGNFGATPTKFGLTNGAPTINTGLYSGGFGTIVPINGTAGQRSGSFVARLTF